MGPTRGLACAPTVDRGQQGGRGSWASQSPALEAPKLAPSPQGCIERAVAAPGGPAKRATCAWGSGLTFPHPLAWAAVDNGALFELDEWAQEGRGRALGVRMGVCVGLASACLSLTP